MQGKRRSPGLGVVIVVAALCLAPAAWASYPGAAGTLAVQRSSEYTIENDNGVTSQTFSLALQPAVGGPFGTPLSCQALDGNFGGQGDQYCPESAPSFAPDGQALAFSGAVYGSDGSAMPSQSSCQNGGVCHQTVIVAAADGSAPRPLTLPLADAKQPAFLPDGQQLIFAGAASDGNARRPLHGQPRRHRPAASHHNRCQPAGGVSQRVSGLCPPRRCLPPRRERRHAQAHPSWRDMARVLARQSHPGV